MTDKEKNGIVTFLLNVELLKGANRKLSKTAFKNLLKANGKYITEAWECYLEARKQYQLILKEQRKNGR